MAVTVRTLAEPQPAPRRLRWVHSDGVRHRRDHFRPRNGRRRAEVTLDSLLGRATRIAWKDVWIGAAATALLFSAGKLAIGLYLGRSAVASAYGVAGSVVLTLLWVYYSAMVFLLGAEFTEVYSRRWGSHIRPFDGAAADKRRPADGFSAPRSKADDS